MIRKLGLALCLLLLGLAPAQPQSVIPAPSTQFVAPIVGTIAAATKIISGIAGKRIYITGLTLIPAATSVVTLTTGTGTNCGTNTANLTGAMTFSAGQVLVQGDGSGTFIYAPLGFDVCITIATAVAPGYIAYAIY